MTTENLSPEEIMNEKNRLDLIALYKKGLELAQKTDWKQIDNISYIEQNGSSIFQLTDKLGQQVRKNNG